MVSFEIFVKAMPPSLSELKVLPSFCFAFKIPDDVTASIRDMVPFFRKLSLHPRALFALQGGLVGYFIFFVLVGTYFMCSFCLIPF